MKITDIRLTGLAGGTVDGGWPEGMKAENVYVIVSINDRLREVRWNYNDDGSLSGTTDDHYFRLTGYTMTASGEQRRTPILSSNLPNLATVLRAAGYHVVLKGKLHLTRPVNYDAATGRYEWSAGDTAHLADRFGFHGWNPPDMSDPMDLSDLGGGRVNNDGRYVDGTGTMAGEPGSYDEMHRQSAVHFLNTYDGDKPFCLIVALVNPHDVQEYPGRGLRGLSLEPT